MTVFVTILESGKENRHQTATKPKTRQINSSEAHPLMNANEGNTDDESETRIFTQEEADEQMGSHMSSL